MEGDFHLAGWLVQPLRDAVETAGQTVQVEPKAMDLLVYLARHAGEVIPKERLIQAVWPDAFVTDEVLTNAIWKLRQSFGDDPKDPRIIQTVPRRGYQLIAEVTFEEEASQSRYAIQEKLGQGAMAEIYLARDMLLARHVALKFALPEMEQNDSWRRRLNREARAAAALDHPFICKVYDTGRLNGRTFIAMEYVEGKTLKERMAEAPLAIDEALRIAKETAEALETAHRKGIVHRDIKPSNIMLTAQGHVKVTDFGLAKRLKTAEGERQDLSGTLTGETSTLGTLPYMSPEQIRGQEVDARSDIFSLGVVLYEMLTGVHPFRRGLSADTAAAVLSQEPPPLSRFREDVPGHLQHVLDRMLAKDREDRYPSMQDVRAGLHEAAARKAAAWPFRSLARRVKKPALVAAALAAVVLITVLAVWSPWRTPSSSQPSMPVPLTSYPGGEAHPALSPDGTYVAFAWDGAEQNNYDIYVQLVGTEEPLRLTTDPAGDFYPTWSPDKTRIAFLRRFSQTEFAVFIKPALGGSEMQLTTTSVGGVLGTGSYDGEGLSWSPDGRMLALVHRSSIDEADSIYLLSLETREKRRLTTPPPGATDSLPAFSPDGTAVAFNREDPQKESLCIQPLAGGEARYLASTQEYLRDLDWTPDGSAIVLTLSKMVLRDSYLSKFPVSGGQPQRLLFGEGAWEVSIARAGGRLAYALGEKDSDIWIAGGPNSPDVLPARFAVSSTRSEYLPLYSPDGSLITFCSDRSGDVEIWRCDAEGKNLQRLTNRGFAMCGEWSPSGREIAFGSTAKGKEIWDIFIMDATGGLPRNLTPDEFYDYVPSWSADGRWIYYASDRSGTMQIFRVSTEGGNPLQLTSGGGTGPLAADGRVLFFREGHIWSVPEDGGEETRILDRTVGMFNWRPWRGNIIYISENGRAKPSIEMLDSATGKTKELHSLKEGIRTLMGLTVSPDGRWILYTQSNINSDLKLVENFR